MKCIHFGKCGGCSLDFDYKKQLELKINKVEFLFNKKIDNTIPSPKTFFYRNRMDYAISEEGNKIIIGLKEKGKWWKFVDLSQCFLMSKESDKIKNLFRDFANLKNLKAWDLKKHKGLLRYLIVREGKFTNERMLIINTSNDYLNKGFKTNKKEELNEEEIKAKEEFHQILLEFFDLLKEKNIEVTSFIHGVNNTITDVSHSFEVNILKGKGLIKEKLNGFLFFVGPNSFFQSNSYTAELMIKEIESLIKELKNKLNFVHLYDLFCGCGTFSIPFYSFFEKIIGVEINKESLELYNKNIEINKLNKNNFTLIESSVEKIIFDLEIRKDDLIIVDPPRSGLNKKLVKWINKQKNKFLIYISCNPETQYRDVSFLTNFKLSKLILVDQFPNTHHIETIALLERKN